jgi:hypothetical protein
MPNYKCGKNQTQAKQLVAAKVWLGTKQLRIHDIHKNGSIARTIPIA